jgi:hypothetical protein
MSITLPMNGRCLCGAVRYAITGEPLLATICHCTRCQKRTGSAYSINLITQRQDFKITQGETVTRELPGETGKVSVHHFCNDCLVRTHTEPAAYPAVTFVRPGTLDDPAAIKPGVQIWTGSALVWALVPQVVQREGNLGDDVREMIAAWQKENCG